MQVKVLDHGYVEFVEAWGTGKDGINEEHGSQSIRDFYWDYEVGIIEAARQSTQGAFRGWEQDQKLLAYLYTHKHYTPFEMAGAVLEVQAPIFVFREWHRHRTQSYNEMSARYAPLPDLYYKPTSEAVQARIEAALRSDNKQSASMDRRVAVMAGHDRADAWLVQVYALYAQQETLYQQALANGIPKELARITMPVGHYTRMRCSANLRNWLGFLTLRMDPAAQWEIRQFAIAVCAVLQPHFPQSMQLFADAT